MPDQCETYLTIEGQNKKVREVVKFLSNKNLKNNPFVSMVNDAFDSEERIESIAEKMYGFHESAPAFGTTVWGLKVTKANIYFTKIWGPPIDIFLELMQIPFSMTNLHHSFESKTLKVMLIIDEKNKTRHLSLMKNLEL